MIDDKEQQVLEDQEISRSRAKTVRYWLDTSAVALAVALLASLLYLVWFVVIPEIKREVVPAIRSWRGVNDQWTETAIKVAPKIDSMMSDGAVAMSDFREGMGRIKTELPGVISDVRELKPGFLRLQSTIDGQIGTLGTTVNHEIQARSADIRNAITSTANSVNNKLNGTEVAGMLANMLEASKGLKVLVNDPNLAKNLSNAEEITASMARTGKKVEVAVDKGNEILATGQESNKNFKLFTDDFQKFSHKHLNPDPPKGFWRKLKHYTFEVLGYGRDGATVVRIYRDLTGPRY